MVTPRLSGAPDFTGVATLAQKMVDRLGSDDNATTALLLAGEAGYSGPQIMNGAEAAELQADGSITDERPDGPTLGRIEVPSETGQKAGTGKIHKRPASQSAAAARQPGDNRILIDKLRSTASGALTDYERETMIGIEGTAFILMLLRMGFSPEQVVDSLVLGLFFYEAHGGCYTQSFPVKLAPVQRRCDDRGLDASPAETDVEVPIAEPAAAASPYDAATYEGDLAALVSAESSIVVSILADGKVSGELTATEELENYIDSVDIVCGLFLDDEEVAEECADALVECAATVVWHSDLGTLTFVGDAPDNGVVSGTITVTYKTTPHGCGEPRTDIDSFLIEATVSPDGALITVPFEIELERVEAPA